MGIFRQVYDSEGQARYLSANSSDTAFTITAGRQAQPASPENFFDLMGHRGARLSFFGTGADNSTFDYKVWLVRRSVKGSAFTAVELVLLGNGTATLSASVGVDGDVVDDSERMADTLTWSKVSATTIENALGDASDVRSPADNTPAELIINCGGAAGIIVEFNMTGATSGNCLIERI